MEARVLRCTHAATSVLCHVTCCDDQTISEAQKYQILRERPSSSCYTRISEIYLYGGICKKPQEAIDTTSTGGKLTFHIFAALAEFERQLIQERTQAGLQAARARGRLGGRPKALSASKQKRAVELYQEKRLAVQDICKIMGISKPTLYAYVRQAQSVS